MYTVYDRAQLLVLLSDFYELTGFRTVVFDAFGSDILSYPQQLPHLCRLVRATENGKKGCLLCDQNACRTARRQNGAVVYLCHAGLREVITPIRVENTIAGYLLLSHIVLDTEEESQRSAVLQNCLRYGVEPSQAAQAFDELPRASAGRLKSAGDLQTLAAKAIYLERLARLVPGSLPDRLQKYLEEHLQEELSSERICRTFSLSRTSLYSLCREAYGCGISQHIAELRVQRAMQLLAGTALSTGEISQRSGFRDYNYFFRVFRAKTGLTPRTYRSRFAGQGNAQP